MPAKQADQKASNFLQKGERLCMEIPPTQEIPLLVMGGLVDEIVFTRRFLLGLGDGAENTVSVRLFLAERSSRFSSLR